MTAQSNLPQAAEEGFKDASAYDTHRPTYPLEAVEVFLQHLNVAKQDEAKIVEIASGTGKFTEILAARPERYTVKAVEPHEPMRNKLAKKDLRGVEILDGKADKMPVDSEWGDACIAAQVRLPICPLIPDMFGTYPLSLSRNCHAHCKDVNSIGISLVRYRYIPRSGLALRPASKVGERSFGGVLMT
jgi:SAM-dependent methyltransferase